MPKKQGKKAKPQVDEEEEEEKKEGEVSLYTLLDVAKDASIGDIVTPISLSSCSSTRLEKSLPIIGVEVPSR